MKQINNIKQIRTNLNITVRELSERSNVAIGYISDIENNKTVNPTKSTMMKISSALGLQVSDVFFTQNNVANNQSIKINNTDLSVKEFKGQRVVTFKDIDMLHERVEGTAGRNFRENKNHLIENEDYFSIKGNELRSFKQATNFVGSNAKEIILITESGYLMLVKSLQDDLAWKVQRELVNNYFRVKTNFNNQDLLLQFLSTLPQDQIKQIIDKLQQSLLPSKSVVQALYDFLANNIECLSLTCEDFVEVDYKIFQNYFESNGYKIDDVFKELRSRNLIQADAFGFCVKNSKIIIKIKPSLKFYECE